MSGACLPPPPPRFSGFLHVPLSALPMLALPVLLLAETPTILSSRYVLLPMPGAGYASA